MGLQTSAGPWKDTALPRYLLMQSSISPQNILTFSHLEPRQPDFCPRHLSLRSESPESSPVSAEVRQGVSHPRMNGCSKWPPRTSKVCTPPIPFGFRLHADESSRTERRGSSVASPSNSPSATPSQELLNSSLSQPLSPRAVRSNRHIERIGVLVCPVCRGLTALTSRQPILFTFASHCVTVNLLGTLRGINSNTLLSIYI